MSTHPLSDLPVGAKGRLVCLNVDPNLRKRLLALGVVLGQELQILHHRSRGIVVQSKGSRIALGGDIADKLQLEIN